MKVRKSFKDCIVKPGETSPYANLLEPQLKRPIKNVWTRSVAKNLSGSKASRMAIFDLHCKDDLGNLIEIEVQIREMKNFVKRLAFYASEMVANQAEPGDDWSFVVQPTYVIALTRFSVFPDERAVHRATVIDMESEELDDGKFKDLTESAKVSNFNKKEFEAYRNMYHKVWDHNALRDGFFKEFADDVNAKIEERISGRNREFAKKMIVLGKLSNEEIAAATDLSLEDVVVLRSQLEA